ncbi:HEAT repeat domain-containing protein [Streptomyces sp. BV286]|uniref:HEAT repeat domain-containing protein n=1 Tax=Streptomyces sp. BV286 TaxID=2849672 RepID=UPI001C2E9AFD|nr:HEAT repeat domain-containing protein [Streptomyces sp. BV286]MBV1938599.1 HEAT repeat domain-containing protein [Streptomyces sp. BV286]
MGTEHQIAFFLRELAGPDARRRSAAAKGLGRIGRHEHARQLAETAGDPVPEVREAAAIGLGRLGVPEAGQRVLPLLMADTDPWVRRAASLSSIKLDLRGDEVVQAYADLLRDPDHHLRINALVGLAAMRIPGDVQALVRLLGDQDGAVWGRARSLIHDLRDDKAVKAEVIRAAREGEGAVRAEALTLLPSRCNKRLLDSLLAGLRDPSPEVRVAVADRLSDVKKRRVRDALTAALDAERDSSVALNLLGILERHSDQRMVEAALRWLRDPVAGPAAAGVLGEANTGAAVEHLRGVIEDTSFPGPNRAAAAKAIGECGRWDAVWLLLPLLDDPDPDAQAGAVDGLGSRVYYGLRLWERRPVARALVARLTSHSDSTWRTANALSGLAEALPALRRLADTSDAVEVRAAALSLLVPEDLDGPGRGAYGTEADLHRLVRGLDDDQEPVRHSAAHGLKQWVAVGLTLPPVGDAVRDRLLTLAQDPSPRVRSAAAEAHHAVAYGWIH